MKNLSLYNLSMLIKVTIEDKKECGYFSYKNFKKNFFGNDRQEGYCYAAYYPYTGGYLCSKENIESGKELDTKFLVDDTLKKVYYFPYVKLHFPNDYMFVKEFRTYEEALEWGKEQAKKCMGVILEV